MSGMKNIAVGLAMLTPVSAVKAQKLAQESIPKKAQEVEVFYKNFGDRAIFTYEGKGKKMKLDNSFTAQTKKRLDAWGVKGMWEKTDKQFKKWVSKVDKTPDGIVTARELEEAGAPVDTTRKVPQQILKLERTGNTMGPSDVTYELQKIGNSNRHYAKMLSEDPVVRIHTSPNNQPYLPVASLGKMSDREAVDYFLKESTGGPNRRLSYHHRDMQPVCFMSENLGKKVIVVPIVKNGPIEKPSMAKDNAFGMRSFTQDPKTQKFKELYFDGNRYIPDDRGFPISDEMNKYLHQNYK